VQFGVVGFAPICSPEAVQVQFGANFGAETVQFFAEWSYGKKGSVTERY